MLGLLLAGCQPSQTLPAELPTALVQITHQVLLASTETASPEPSVTPTPRPLSLQELAKQTYGGRLIERIEIPAIAVNSPVVTVGWQVDRTNGSPSASAEWDLPGPAVGWILTSALPDRPGNIILYGHNNMYGSVFRNLGKLTAGDALSLQTAQASWHYQVDRVVFLPVLLATAGQRQAYQAYLADTTLPRLTVISCWPPESNTYRLIVIAYPVLNP